MKTLGLELCDEGFLAAESEGLESALIALEDGAVASPAFVYHDGTGYLCGRQAETRARIYPRSVSDGCWDQLSLRASELTVSGKIPRYSELAYHHLRHVWERLKHQRAIDKLTLALPSDYLLGRDGDEEKIGLILGMVEDLKIPLVGMVDMACAAVAAQKEALEEKTSTAFHLDIHQRATFISLLRLGRSVLHEQLMRSPLGWGQVMGELMLKLANRFLSQTAFDITHSAETEQQFYMQIKALLERLKKSGDGTIEMGGLKRLRKMTVSRDSLAKPLETINQAVVKLVDKAWSEAGGGDKGAEPLFISERASRLPGLVEALAQWGKGVLISMPLGAAACGAAAFGADKAVLQNLEEAPLTTSMALKRESRLSTQKGLATPQSGPPASPAESETSFRPTHLVLAGMAHRLEPEGFYLGPAIPQGSCGLPLPEAFGSDTENPSCLRRSDGRLILENHSGGGILLNQRPARSWEYLQIGDHLTVGHGSQRVELLLIYCLA